MSGQVFFVGDLVRIVKFHDGHMDMKRTELSNRYFGKEDVIREISRYGGEFTYSFWEIDRECNPVAGERHKCYTWYADELELVQQKYEPASLSSRVDRMEHSLVRMCDKISELVEALKYAPGGEEAEKAKDSFQALVADSSSSSTTK